MLSEIFDLLNTFFALHHHESGMRLRSLLGGDAAVSPLEVIGEVKNACKQQRDTVEMRTPRPLRQKKNVKEKRL